MVLKSDYDLKAIGIKTVKIYCMLDVGLITTIHKRWQTYFFPSGQGNRLWKISGL